MIIGVAVGVGVGVEVGVGDGVGLDESTLSSSDDMDPSVVSDVDDPVDAPTGNPELGVGVTVAPLITMTVPGVGVGVG